VAEAPTAVSQTRTPNALATSVFGLAIVVLGAVQLMLVLDGTIINIALPHLQQDPAIGLSDANLSWAVNGYALAFGGLLLLGGRSGDALGRRRMFIIGIAVFTGASLLGACAWNEAALIGARVLQGGARPSPRRPRWPWCPRRLRRGPCATGRSVSTQP